MGRKWKKTVVFLTLFAVIAGICPGGTVSRADEKAPEDYKIKCIAAGGGPAFYRDDFYEAYKICVGAGGGEITFQKNNTIGHPTGGYDDMYGAVFVYYTIPRGVTVRINSYGFNLRGQMKVEGFLDLENSDGELYGTGKVFPAGETEEAKAGHWKRKSYTVEGIKDNKVTANDITYGQTLADATIEQKKQVCTASVEGVWKFKEPEAVPKAGINYCDVIYCPNNQLSYSDQLFSQGGCVNVKQDTPLRKNYQTPEIIYGQRLGDAKPGCAYVAQLTGVNVPGKIEFTQAEETNLKVGTNLYNAVFKPDSANYCSVPESVNVRVLPATPEIVSPPVPRKNGVRGGTLQEVSLYSGVCRNPYSKDVIQGHWEWKNPEEQLWTAEKECAVIFVADASENYKTVETTIKVKADLVTINDIAFPNCTDIMYGQTLGDSTLSYEKNEYGTFEWENAGTAPSVKDKRASVIFTPVAYSRYDWSKLEGYDAATGTVKRQIPINVKPIKGTLPRLKAGAVVEGDSVQKSELTSVGTSGQVQWRNPMETVKESGQREAVFTPSDSVNYDWSSFRDEKTGEILIPVTVPVIAMAKPASEAEYGQRLDDILLETDGSCTCRWENGEEMLGQVGLVSYPVIYEQDGVEYRRMIEVCVKKKSQPAPGGITAGGCSEMGKCDGCIYGVNDRMEYRLEQAQDYQNVTEENTVIAGLAPGKYYVRYRETEYCAAGEETEIEVVDGLPPTPEPTPTPTEEPTPTPTEEPTPTPAEEQTPAPTEGTALTPAEEQTPAPTGEQTPAPAEEQTSAPTGEQTPMPAEEQTPVPTGEPISTPVGEILPTEGAVLTEKPAFTEEPTHTFVTDQPIVTVVPEEGITSEEPMRTSGAVFTAEPEKTPGISEELEETLPPAPTIEPEVTPEVSVEPSVIPEVSAEPSVTPGVSAEPSVIPEVSAEPSRKPEAAFTARPGNTSRPSAKPTGILPTAPAVKPTAAQSTGGAEKPEEAAATVTAAANQAAVVKSPVKTAEPIIITKMASRLSNISSSSLSVIPRKEVIKKIKRKGTTAKVTCKKMRGVKYQLQYGRNRKFRKSQKVTAAKPVFKVRKLNRYKTYYFRVRAWRKFNGRRVYGAWSKVRKL